MRSQTISQTAPTVQVTIFMAGDLELAKQTCQEYVNDVGLCVTIEPVSYIYTGGKEDGVRVGLINYPKYPGSKQGLFEQATKLANVLRQKLGQMSYSIVGPDLTLWSDLRGKALSE